MQHIAGCLDPVVEEGRLHLADYRAFDLEVHVAPMIGILGMAAPLIGDSNTAGEAQVAIDDQHFAMGPVVDPRHRIPAQRVIAHDLDSRLLHAIE